MTQTTRTRYPLPPGAGSDHPEADCERDAREMQERWWRDEAAVASSPAPFNLIPRDKLAGQIGKRIHIQGIKPGCCWRLLSIDGDWINCETPVTRKPARFLASRAQYTRGNDPENVVYE